MNIIGILMIIFFLLFFISASFYLWSQQCKAKNLWSVKMIKTEQWSAKSISTFKSTIEMSTNVYFTAKNTKDSCFYGKLSNGSDISNSLIKLDLALRECFDRLFIEWFVNINI